MQRRTLHFSILFFVFALGIVLGIKKNILEHSTSYVEREELEATYAYESMLWYNNQRAYPTGHIPENWRQKAYEQIERNNFQKSSSATSISWSELGPGNIGGRVRSIAIDPTNSNIIYCGSVSGGIWKTTNAGASWFSTSDFVSNLVIGCLAIDPTNPNIIYAGTGEGYFNVDALRGAGVLKSTDGGATWNIYNSFALASTPYYYYYINKIIVRPDNPSILYAALSGSDKAVWRSTNGGVNWSKLSVASTSSFCVDLVSNPTNANVMYAAFGFTVADGIYKTTNGGANWSKLSSGLPTTGYGRISLAVAPSNPSILYAVFENASTYNTYSIDKSTDGGATWSAVANPLHLGGQGWYNNAITVHPTDPNTVVIGGINLFKTTNGGTSWSSISVNVHVDQHALVYDKVNPNILYVGNDGGVYKSVNGGGSFSPINNNLAITQFYSGAVDPTQAIYYGGTQDNGTIKSIGTSSWFTVLGGDGGVTIVDFTTPTIVYTEYVFLDIQKSTDAGSSWSKVMNGIPLSSDPTISQGTSDRCSFIAPFAMDPSNSQVLVAGTFKAYRTTNGGGSWSAISSNASNGDLTGDGDGAGQVTSPNSTITAIAIAKTSSATIYVGTSGSSTATARVQVTTNTGVSWTNRTGTLPDQYVTSIGIDRNNAAHAIVTVSGYGTGHIFATTNTGVSWANISGNLPDVPVNKIVIQNTNHFIVGTDLGVFESVNGGTNWIQQNTGLANVSVADLDLRSDGILFAATHGRGMFQTTSPVAVQEERSTVPSEFSLKQNYPNPFNPSTKISFSIAKQSFVQLTIYDALGRTVSTLVDQQLPAGSYTTTFNAGEHASGIYFYTLNAGDFILTKKMLLLK